MKKISKKELREIIQSGHLNFLIGSGCSLNYLSTLSDIETRMNDNTAKEQAQKEYFQIIKKSKAVLDERRETDPVEKGELAKTKQNYDKLLGLWAEILSKRSLHIVNKQVNVFTTNFDMFIEDSCERLGIPYNDGFAGQLHPVFNVSNFNRIQKYKSLQFDNISDVPLFNILKLHGCLSWRTQNGEKICYSDGAHIDDNLDTKTGEDFLSDYKDQVAVINPNAEKHLETVLDVNYASMLRKFTLELEKENSVLLIFGFSLNDQHIRNLLYGVMKTNPTLIVLYFSFSQYDVSTDRLEESKNPNFYVIFPYCTKSTFIEIFGEGQESKWEQYVVDQEVEELRFVSDIGEKIDLLPDGTADERKLKARLSDIIRFPFSMNTTFISEIFTKKPSDEESKNELPI